MVAGTDQTNPVAADPMVPKVFRITGCHGETADTFTLELKPPAGEFRFAPGQFNMLYVFGIGEVPISISGDPMQTNKLVHTCRSLGLVTQAMNRLGEGDSLGVRGPFGRGWPLQEALGRDLVIIAGGLGLAPLRPAIYHLLRHREHYGRIAILCGARSPADLLFRHELALWRERDKLYVDATVDTADRSWHGKVGVVTRLVAQCAFDPGNAVALLCGPEIMMRYAIAELADAGLGSESIYISMERNMKCAVGFCGHCQFGPHFLCKDGPVLRYDQVEQLFRVREI